LIIANGPPGLTEEKTAEIGITAYPINGIRENAKRIDA
jgi:hypothetical protein